jgi:hypothetical protein
MCLNLLTLWVVRSFGTEGRRGKDEVPPSDNVFEYIVFRGSDVKDLKVEQAAKKVEPPPRGVPDDPAILAVWHPPPLHILSCGLMNNFGYSIVRIHLLISPLPSF